MCEENITKDKYIQLSLNREKLLNVTSKDMEYILKHYNVSKNELQDILNSIKDWYEKQPHLPKNWLEEHMIIKHLILKKFSIEDTKDKIDACISAKHKMPEILLNRDPLAPEIDKCLRFGFFIVMPKKTPDNCRLTIFRIKTPYDHVAIDIAKMTFMMIDYRIHNDVSLGDQWIYDLRNFTFQNSVQLTPALINKLVYYIRFCYGVSIKGMHFVNVPPFVTPIINLVKKLMKQNVAERIKIYTSFDELFKIFPKNIFPKEYGGDEISCDEISEEWTKTLQSDIWRKHFAEQDNILSDESKRTRFMSSDDFFGCEGSFRKLELD